MRLNECQISSCLYIVEGLTLTPSQHPNSQGGGIGSSAIRTAIVSTQIEGGLHVLRTRGIDHTISTLRANHCRIARRFAQGRCGYSFQSFEAFQKRCGKKQVETVGELFCYAMRQLPLCAGSGAFALQQRFGTFANLLEYIDQTDPAVAQVPILFIILQAALYLITRLHDCIYLYNRGKSLSSLR